MVPRTTQFGPQEVPIRPQQARRNFTRTNNRIRVSQVRLIGPDGEQVGILETREALSRARALDLDLVEIAPQATPPVCRIMDFGKFKYDEEKKKKQARRHQSHTRLKEVKFHANVEEHDYQTKIRHARDFLEAGHRVKYSLYFRGRENAHQELGFEVMNRAMKDCADIGNPEQPPRLVGRSVIMLMTPKPTTK